MTVIIPTYNEEEYIGDCLKSVLDNKVDFNYEIIVIDGGSSDNTCLIVNKTAKSIKLLHNKHRFTSHALNIGIKEAKGHYIQLLGAHSYVPGNYLQKAYDTISAHDAVCVGGKVIIISKTQIGKEIAYALQSPFGVGSAKFRYSDKLEFVDTVAYGCYKKEIFEDIGYFDEELIRGQDYELNHRITQSGKNILYTPDYYSYWYSRPTLKQMMKQQFLNGFWKVLGQLKRKKIASYRHIIPGLFVLTVIMLLILSLVHIYFKFCLVMLVLLYFILAIYYSLKAEQAGLRRWLVPSIFILIHFSYGLGYLIGLVYFPVTRAIKSIIS